VYIFYLFDFFLFSVLGKREKIWHWDKAGFRLPKKAVKPKAAKPKMAKTPKKTHAKKPAADKKAAKAKAKKPAAAKKPTAKPAKKATKSPKKTKAFFLFSVLGKREKIWHWDKAGFRFANCEITV
jgi:hypothetical protein